MDIIEAGTDNLIQIDAAASVALAIRVTGNHNRLIIGKNVRLTGYMLEITGDHCSVVFHDDAMMNGNVYCCTSNTHLSYGRGTTAMHIMISLHEAGTITIGDDCMISGGVQMDVSDMHSIMDRTTGERINKAKDIVLGEHVWLAEGVTVAKGCRIGSGSVIGAKSFVRGDIPRNVIAAGVPARVIREHIEWSRALL